MKLFKFRKEKNEFDEVEMINYLNDHDYYSDEIKLIEPRAISLLNFDSEWKTILSIDSREERISRTIKLWQENAKAFDVVIGVFNDNLISVDTLLYHKEIWVVYSLKLSTKMAYYLGKLPIKANDIVNKLPDAIKDFYSKVHDGFIIFPDNNLGLLPANDFYCLGEDLLQEEFLPDIPVKDTYMIFSNAGGDGVVYDVSQVPAKGFTYFHDDHESCDFNNDPVNVIDTWLKMMIDDE